MEPCHFPRSPAQALSSLLYNYCTIQIIITEALPYSLGWFMLFELMSQYNSSSRPISPFFYLHFNSHLRHIKDNAICNTSPNLLT